MVKNPTFLEAKKNPQLRQVYLDSIMPLCPESVKELVYDPYGIKKNQHIDELASQNLLNHLTKEEIASSKKRPFEAYIAVIYSPALIGERKQHPMFFSRFAFEKYNSAANFLSSVLDHETIHIDSLVYGIDFGKNLIVNRTNANQVDWKILLFADEVRAYNNQIEKLSERGIKDLYFREWLDWQLTSHEDLLLMVNSKTELEERIKENLLYSSF